jgi:hypothetical protein
MPQAGMVEVELGGMLARHTKGGTTAGVEAGQTVLEAIVLLGIPPNQLLVALVNGQTCDLSYHLAPGDLLKLLPAISGGE